MARNKAEAPVDEEEARGRKILPANAERLEHILKRTIEEPGVESPVLAAELDITTLACSHLADRLVKAGHIAVFKTARGVRTYYTPKALAKVQAKLEAARDREVAAREDDRAEKNRAALAALKEQKAAGKANGKKAADPLIGDAPAPRRGRSKKVVETAAA